MLIKRVFLRISPFLLMVILSGILLDLHAQDTFYFNDGSSMTGTYQGTNKDKVLYTSFNSSKVQKLKAKNLALITNPRGTFRIYEGSNERLINFLNEDFDLIVLQGGNFTRAEHVTISKSMISCIEYQTGNQINLPVESCRAIIYRNKQLLPLGNINNVVTAIWAAEQAGMNNISNLEYDSTTPVQTSNTVEETMPPYQVEEDSNISDLDRGQNPAPNNTSESMDENEVTIVNGDEGELSNNTGLPLDGPQLPVDEKEFQTKALRKTQQFTNYINRIIDKEASRFEANKAINQAITLFVNDTCFVEVSNLKTLDKTKYYVREYLYHIQELKYDRVEVEWAEINYVGDIKLGPDGNWYGTVTYLQVFRGFRDGQIIYQDKTLKRMEVILRSYEKVSEGKTELLWDVLLSNIAVEHTS